jgi:hypothetical protein
MHTLRMYKHTHTHTHTEYFTSFGVVPLLFCVHFAVLSIERSMQNRSDFPAVLNRYHIQQVLIVSTYS